MADDRYTRFRHLERPRTADEAGARDGRAGTEGRFGALEERKPQESAAGVASGHLDRFRPAAERPLEVALPAEGELPFIRCASCQMDHNRAAAFCTNCGADLRTEVQRAFNAALAGERRAQSAQETAEVEAFRRGRAEAEVEAAEAKRAMAESLAREVGDAERRRLDGEMGGFGRAPGGWGSGWEGTGWGGGWGWGRRRGPGLIGWLLFGLLRLLFGGRWR